MTRNLSLTLALLFFIAHALFAQWQPVRMPGTFFNSRATVGDSVLIVCPVSYPAERKTYRSADFGSTWTALPDSLADYTYAVREADGYIYAYSLDKTIISADGGLSWSFLGIPNDPDQTGYPKTFLHDTLLFGMADGTVVRRFPSGARDTVFVDSNGYEIHVLERFDRRLIRASLSGISYSDDGGNSWQSAGGVPDLQQIPALYEMHTARQGARVFILALGQQNSLLLRSDDLGASWQLDTSFDPGGCNKNRLWATSRAIYLETHCIDSTGHAFPQWQMTPPDANWNSFTPYRANLHLILETDSVLLGAYQWNGALYRSTDQGANWYDIYPNYGSVFSPAVFYHWPDGHSLQWHYNGWHVKTDSAALYRYLPRVADCVEPIAQRGDSLFGVCPFSQGIIFTPDRGITWDTLAPFTPPGYIKMESLFWDEDGLFAQIANPDNNIRKLGRWSFEQNDWTDLKDLPDGIQDLAKAGGKLFALADDVGGGKIFVSADAGDTWSLLGNKPAGAYINRLENGGDALFAAIDAQVNRVYRTDNSGQTWYKLPVINHPVSWHPIAPNKILTAPDEMLFMVAANQFLYSEDGGFNWIHMADPVNLPNLHHEILHIGPDGQVYVVSNNTLLRRPTSDFRRLVARARVLWDSNGNGTADTTDLPVAGIPVSSAWYTVLTDSAGMARVGLRTDFLADTLYVHSFLPNIGVSPAFHPATDPSSVYTFLLVPDTPRYLQVQILPFAPPRPGFENLYQLQVSNYGAQPESGRLKFRLDPRMQWLTAQPPPDATSGDTLFWQINSLEPFQSFKTEVSVRLSALAPLGDLIRMKAEMEVDSSALGWVQAAYDSLSMLIVGSYDPNDKQVTPAGNLDPQAVNDGLELAYTVRFQNTGTYLAENVLLVDTLPAQLDARTFRFLGASHPCQVRLKAQNVLEFYFENIQLPDSNANEPASHGFVRFSIRPFAGLALGTVIQNSADIYFDYNAPIRTNATLNTILLGGRDLSPVNILPLHCQPNPARDEIWIDWPETGDAEARLYRWDGALAAVVALKASGKNRLQLGYLPAGAYAVQVFFEGRLYGGRFVKM